MMLNQAMTNGARTPQMSAVESSIPNRVPANRAAHPDDERFVARGSAS